MKMKHILVLGAGSVGKRHLSNFASLGCRTSAMDPRGDRLAEAAMATKLEGRYADLEEALKQAGDFDGAVVASPPKFHCQQCLALTKAGLPILLEKPVSPELKTAGDLERELARISGAKLLLGYTYRWWPPLTDFLNRLRSGHIGKPLHAKFVMSAHLADWHPWERYQDFFMASKELGGGALLDESHFIDLMLWFFGMPDRVSARVERLSTLEIETDDNVDMVAVYPTGLRVVMHLDLFGRPHEKYISVTGEEGTLLWSFEPNRINYSQEIAQVWETSTYEYQRNDMFVRLAEEFLSVLDGTGEIGCTLRDGINVLKVIEACRASSETERTMSIKEIDL
jgi:predicted dehydrogenase